MFKNSAELEKNYLISLAWKALKSEGAFSCTLSEAEAMEALEEAEATWLESEAIEFAPEAMKEAWSEAIAEAESQLHQLCKKGEDGLGIFCEEK